MKRHLTVVGEGHSPVRWQDFGEPPAWLREVIHDLPLDQLIAFGQNLAELTHGNPTHEEAIALRIAGDPDIFGAEVPLAVAWDICTRLVNAGVLCEDDIARVVA